ncbi:MAG: cell division protein FtsA [Candidatus Borkfalkiaceae bacterium]|nr:cell division FtsA domain-containing protein [Clostridia bacterium]MDY6223422.1 cell division protein FtsA [Christensenellaceae bacterium]
MKNESVAIFDIRSYTLTFLIGGRGVNGTFVYRGSESENYDGYGTEGFFDVSSFTSAATRVLNRVLSSYEGTVRKIYVTVPSPFFTVRTKGQTLSFERRRKITAAEIEALYASGLNELAQSGRFVKQSAMYFSIGDNRRYFSAADIVGTKTSMLSGALCYYFVGESFYRLIQKLFACAGFTQIEYLPQALSQSAYLLPAKTREGYAALLDIGYVSSAIAVAYGGGIVHQESFDCGAGQILAALMQEFGIEFSRAEEMLAAADISGGAVQKNALWRDADGNAYPVQRVNDVIKCALDELCEKTDDFFQRYYGAKKIAGDSGNPLYLTGEGLQEVKGLAEHVERRLCRVTQTVFPEIPYYDKPTYSSRISALQSALEDTESKAGIRKFFNIFGGNRT